MIRIRFTFWSQNRGRPTIKRIRFIFRRQNPQKVRLFDTVRLFGFWWYDTWWYIWISSDTVPRAKRRLKKFGRKNAGSAGPNRKIGRGNGIEGELKTNKTKSFLSSCCVAMMSILLESTLTFSQAPATSNSRHSTVQRGAIDINACNRLVEDGWKLVRVWALRGCCALG